MADINLKNKAVSSVVWTTIQKISSVIIGFFSSIILARLLSPEDYGCIGMLSIFMVISNAFIEGGFGSALVQKKRPTQEDYSTVFYWNIMVSTACYIILFLAAPLIATYYRMPILVPVLRVQSLSLIINSLQTVHINQMYKQFRFKKIAIIYLINTSITLPITIWMAYSGFGVWTLVYSNLLTVSVPTAIYWITNKWKPLLTFSKSSFKELFGFGAYILAGSLITQTLDNIQGLFIGRMYNPSRMGYYSKANSTQQLATQTITQIISQVSFPLFSELQDNRVQLINALKKLNTTLAFITFPLIFLLILIAKPLFIILYSDKWLECVPYFQILCLAGITMCLQSSNGQVIKSLGLSKTTFKWTIINSMVGLILILGGFFLGGIMGMLIGMVLRMWFIYGAYTRLISIHVGYSIRKQLFDLSPFLLISILSCIICTICTALFSVNFIVAMMMQIILFLTLYALGTYLFCEDVVNDFIQIIKPILSKLKR